MNQKMTSAPILGFLLIITIITPVFGEVATLQLNNRAFSVDDEIVFSGTLDEDLRGLVSIVIRDPNNEFVMLLQGIIEPDGTYEKSILVNSEFSLLGNYNATAFVYNMTSGKTVNFEITDGFREQKTILPIPEMSIPEPPAEPESKIADFVDPTKDPKYYVDRYNSEQTYRAWFDRNYPGLTIEEAVGYQFSDFSEPKMAKNKIIPDAEAASEINDVMISSGNNFETGPMALAIGGLVVLMAAVYGIKLKVDDNSKQITVNREKIKQKLSGLFRNDPFLIIGNRLAKGEISIEEYNKLSEAINELKSQTKSGKKASLNL